MEPAESGCPGADHGDQLGGNTALAFLEATIPRIDLAILPLLAASTVGVARAECIEPASSVRLVLSLEDAEAAFSTLDLDGFQQAMDESAVLVPCLDVVVPRPTAARYHRLQGLRAWLVRDDDRASRAFLSARRVEPAYRFGTDLVPEGHPTRTAYMSLPMDDAILEDLAPTPSGAFLVDGRREDRKPSNLPTMVQLIDDAGKVRWTRYTWPGDPLPPFPPDMMAEAQGHPWRVPLIVTSATSAVAAGTLYALASRSFNKWNDPNTPEDEGDRYRAQTNGLFAGSVGTGALAIGAGIGAAWTFR